MNSLRFGAKLITPEPVSLNYRHARTQGAVPVQVWELESTDVDAFRTVLKDWKQKWPTAEGRELSLSNTIQQVQRGLSYYEAKAFSFFAKRLGAVTDKITPYLPYELRPIFRAPVDYLEFRKQLDENLFTESKIYALTLGQEDAYDPKKMVGYLSFMDIAAVLNQLKATGRKTNSLLREIVQSALESIVRWLIPDGETGRLVLMLQSAPWNRKSGKRLSGITDALLYTLVKDAPENVIWQATPKLAKHYQTMIEKLTGLTPRYKEHSWFKSEDIRGSFIMPQNICRAFADKYRESIRKTGAENPAALQEALLDLEMFQGEAPLDPPTNKDADGDKSYALL